MKIVAWFNINIKEMVSNFEKQFRYIFLQVSWYRMYCDFLIAKKLKKQKSCSQTFNGSEKHKKWRLKIWHEQQHTLLFLSVDVWTFYRTSLTLFLHKNTHTHTHTLSLSPYLSLSHALSLSLSYTHILSRSHKKHSLSLSLNLKKLPLCRNIFSFLRRYHAKNYDFYKF